MNMFDDEKCKDEREFFDVYCHFSCGIFPVKSAFMPLFF